MLRQDLCSRGVTISFSQFKGVQSSNRLNLSTTVFMWCDLVILSATLAQKQDFLALIRKAVQLGKRVAVGDPCCMKQCLNSYNKVCHPDDSSVQ